MRTMRYVKDRPAWVYKERKEQAEIEFTSFSLKALAEEVRHDYFPEITDTPDCIFTFIAPIAYIRQPSERDPKVCVNAFLNHPETPAVVIREILVHEFVHILVPGERLGCKWVSHTEAFWEKERRLLPDQTAWPWLYINMWPGLVRVKDNEYSEGGIYVNPRWLKRERSSGRLPLEETLGMFPKEKEEGAPIW